MRPSTRAFAFAPDDMRERLSRVELRAAKKRQLALEAMTEVGLTKLEQPDFTAYHEQAPPLSLLSLRATSQNPTGCRSHRSSIAKRSLRSLGGASRCPRANEKPQTRA